MYLKNTTVAVIILCINIMSSLKLLVVMKLMSGFSKAKHLYLDTHYHKFQKYFQPLSSKPWYLPLTEIPVEISFKKERKYQLVLILTAFSIYTHISNPNSRVDWQCYTSSITQINLILICYYMTAPFTLKLTI